MLQSAPLGKEFRKEFVFAGRAYFTVKNEKTGKHFTFRLVKAKPLPNVPETFFAKVFIGDQAVTGSRHYAYIGIVRNGRFIYSAKSELHPDSTPVRGFDWAIRHLVNDNIPDYVQFLHDGRCGRCARHVTHPTSILSGMGEECARVMGIKYGTA